MRSENANLEPLIEQVSIVLISMLISSEVEVGGGVPIDLPEIDVALPAGVAHVLELPPAVARRPRA